MSPAKLPSKKLAAAGSERVIDLQNMGVPTVLIFHARETAELARVFNNNLREKYPTASDALIASVVDLHSIPRLLRGVTEGMINKAYDDTAEELDEGQAAEDFIIILPDWDGKITRDMGFKNTGKWTGVAVLDSSGELIGIYQGKEPARYALRFLEKADQ